MSEQVLQKIRSLEIRDDDLSFEIEMPADNNRLLTMNMRVSFTGDTYPIFTKIQKDEDELCIEGETGY